MFEAVTCRPGIIFPTILLNQNNTNPAECHCMAVKRTHRYLRSTDDGLHFWRSAADPCLPTTKIPTLHRDNHNINLPNLSSFEPMSFADVDWAANLNTRRSVSGTAVFLAGAPTSYKCKLKQSVALSSTESELYAACEAAKSVKCVRSVMSHLGFKTSEATKIFEGNDATIAVSNNERATKRLRHVDLRHFAILDWVKNGEIALKSISRSDNPPDELTKPLDSILHSRHADTLLGKRPPSYCDF